MDVNKILSIVIPTYNMEKYLDRCLSSLIIDENHMQMLEVLVINDGSKDKSSEIAHQYESNFPDIFRVIDKENGNYGSCINRGLDEAVGKYIKVLDADDFFANDNLADFVSYLSTCNDEMVITQTLDNYSDGRTKLLAFDNLPERESRGLESLTDDTIRMLFIHSVAYLLSAVRRQSYRQLEGISYTDLQWVTEPLKCISSFSCYHKVIYNYVLGRTGQTVDDSIRCRNIWMEEKVILYCCDIFESGKGSLPDENINYLRKKLHFLASKIYEYYLFLYMDVLPEKDLLTFDDSLGSICPDIYKSTGDVLYHSNLFRFDFHYIRCFRKHKTRYSLEFRLFDKYSSLKKYFSSK